MARFAGFLRYAAFGWMLLVGLFGGAFAAGEAFSDPGGWAAVGLVASWLVPLAVLAVLGLVRPEVAQPVFGVATAAVAIFTVLDSAVGIVPRDDWGPVSAIAVLALGAALGFFGLRRPRRAGVLLLVIAATQLVATLLESAGEGPVLGGSSGAVIVPLLIGGLLFLPAAAPGATRSTASLAQPRQ